MCKCKNVAMGSYDNQILLKNPFYPINSRKEYVNIDKCLQEEILQLWENGIQTIECCCGHNKSSPYIAVVENRDELMVELGYERCVNNCTIGRLGFFKPKTV